MLCITMKNMPVDQLNWAVESESVLSDICMKTASRILYLDLIYSLFFFFCHIAECCVHLPIQPVSLLGPELSRRFMTGEAPGVPQGALGCRR